MVGRRQRLHRRLQGQLQDPEGSKYELQPDGTHTLYSVKSDVGSKEVKRLASVIVFDRTIINTLV
jgi:hypothetical protein